MSWFSWDGQRHQRAAAGPADHDLPHQVTGQLLPPAPRPDTPSTSAEDCPVPVRLASSRTASCPAIACLQRLQHRRLPGQRRARHRLAEDLADHHRQLLGLLASPGRSSAAVSWTAAVAADRSARS